MESPPEYSAASAPGGYQPSPWCSRGKILKIVPWKTMKQHMIQSFATQPGRLDKNMQTFLDLCLANIFRQRAGSNLHAWDKNILLFQFRTDQALAAKRFFMFHSQHLVQSEKTASSLS